MKKFILVSDVNATMTLKEQGFQLVGQDGKCWYFLNDEEKLMKNKALFAKKKVKFATTDKMLFNDFNGVQYIKS